MARKKKPEEHENHERWLVSYADFITLLFAFFVVMFATSQVDSNKMGRFVEAVNVAFEYKGVFPTASANPIAGEGGGGGSTPTGKPSLMPSKIKILPGMIPDRRSLDMKKSVESLLKKSKLADKVKMRIDQRGVTVSLAEAGFFDPGSASIQPDSMQTIQDIGSVLRDAGAPIDIEGHTDNTPIRTAQFPSNWELSTARATAIIEILIEQLHYDPALISASGYGQYRPIGDNATAEGRAQNRRVDIVILSEAAIAASGKPMPRDVRPDPSTPDKWGGAKQAEEPPPHTQM